MKAHGTLLLLVGTLTLVATAPTPRHQLQHREIHPQQHTTQPEYEYDYEGTAGAAAEPEESASHYDAYIAQVQQSNADKKGFSRGSGLRTIAVGSANQAKTALGNQAAAGYQAAYVAKNTLAQSAAQASATAQAALAGKQVIMSGLEQQVRDAKVSLQGEEMQLQQAKRAAQSAAQAAQQAMHQVNVIQAALNAAQATSENANEAASQAAGELGAQTAMVGAARQRVSTLQEQLHGVRIDFEATQAAARKAQGAAQQAQANAAEAAAKAAAAGLGGHKDAAYEVLAKSEDESKEEPRNTKPYNIASTTPSLSTTFKNTTRVFTTRYSNTGPVKFEFVIPPLPLDDIENEQEQMISISNELGNTVPSPKTSESHHHEVHKLMNSPLPNTTSMPHAVYWFTKRTHEADENISNEPNSEEETQKLNPSKDTLHALQNPSRKPMSTQPVNEDQSEATSPTTMHASNQSNHASYLSEYRYNPAKHEKLLQDNIFKNNELDDTQQKKSTHITRHLSIPLQVPPTTQANFYLKSHTSKFIYEPRYQFHHDPEYLESEAQLGNIITALQNTSYTISNLTDPDYKRAHNHSAPSNVTPTPRTAPWFKRMSEIHEKHEDPVDVRDVRFEENNKRQNYTSVVETALQNALFKIPKSTKFGQSSTRTLITPAIKPTSYEPWDLTYQPRTPQQDYPKKINNSLKKYTLSKAEEPQQEEEDCEEEK